MRKSSLDAVIRDSARAGAAIYRQDGANGLREILNKTPPETLAFSASRLVHEAAKPGANASAIVDALEKNTVVETAAEQYVCRVRLGRLQERGVR